MKRLGANQMVECYDIDQEDWKKINAWMEEVLEKLQSALIEERLDYLDLKSLDESENGIPCRNRPFMAKLKVRMERQMTYPHLQLAIALILHIIVYLSCAEVPCNY